MEPQGASFDTATLLAIVELQTRVVEAGINKPSLMQTIATGAKDLTGADAAAVELREGDEMVYAAVSGTLLKRAIGLRLKIAKSLSGLCMSTKTTLHCLDSETDERVDRAACRMIGCRSMTVVPLQSGGNVIGVLKVFSVIPGTLPESRTSALNLLARLLGGALRNADELNAEKDKLESVFRDSPAAMTIWRGRDLVFEKVNPRYQSIYGGRELIGKKLLDALPELATQKFPAMLQHVFDTGESVSGHEVLAQVMTDKDSEPQDRYYDLDYHRIADSRGTPYGVYSHAVDVTDRVLARLELEKSKEDAERANSAKTYFLWNISHEIRTPLSAILGFAELVSDETVDARERAKYQDTIKRNGLALTSMVDDILDMAKIEASQIRIENSDVAIRELIEHTTDLFQNRINEKKLFVKIELGNVADLRISSDPIRLRQILMNIVGNAVKFTDEGGITVRARLEESEVGSNRIVISVQDTGIGIRPEDRATLFKPFAQVDSSGTRKYGGTGLGLALSSRLAEALGGKIEIKDSESGKGLIFEISFLASLVNPAVSTAATENTSDTMSPMSLSNVKILVADDSTDNQFLVQRLLLKQGAIVELAANGLEAIEKSQASKFDLILMDIQMPIVDGYEATQKIRASGFDGPIIALTAHAMAEDRARSQASGCDGHITKPVNKTQLLALILDKLDPASNQRTS